MSAAVDGDLDVLLARADVADLDGLLQLVLAFSWSSPSSCSWSSWSRRSPTFRPLRWHFPPGSAECWAVSVPGSAGCLRQSCGAPTKVKKAEKAKKPDDDSRFLSPAFSASKSG